MGRDPGIGSWDVGAAHMGGHARDSPLAAVAGREAAAREQEQAAKAAGGGRSSFQV